jgi:hypothetical protein
MLGIEVVAAAEEVDGGLEVLPVPASPSFDGHDFDVESKGERSGWPLPSF